MKLHYRFIALFMAFTVVASTSGIAVSKHICDNVIKKIAINHNAEPCIHKEEEVKIECPEHGEMVLTYDQARMDCCEDTTDYYKDDNPKNLSISEITVIPQLFVLFVIVFPEYNFNVFNTNQSLNPDNLVLPPLIDQDIPVLVQSFLL